MTDTVAPGATAAPVGADLAPVVTTSLGTTPSPEETRVPTVPHELPTQAPVRATAPGAPASLGTTLTPSTTGPTGITVVPAAPTPSPAEEGREWLIWCRCFHYSCTCQRRDIHQECACDPPEVASCFTPVDLAYLLLPVRDVSCRPAAWHEVLASNASDQ